MMEDCTAEKVEEMLANGSGRLFLCGAEGGVFDIMAGRCNKGSSNFEIYLKSHSGESLRAGRISRVAIADRPILTMAYAVQPDVLSAMLARPEFRGRGMLARFLYAMPISPLGSRRVRDVPAVPDHVKSEYLDLIRRLYGIPHAAKPQVLILARDAQEMMIGWREEVERMLAPDGELEVMRDWGGKLPGLTASSCHHALYRV
jgi:replicative DNA helicase